MSVTNVSQFAQLKKHHEQHCIRNNVSSFASTLKARLHGRFLLRQLDAIFVALKLQQVSDMFEIPAISRRQIALKIAPGLHVRFWSCILLGATKIASNCRDKNRLCKGAFNAAFSNFSGVFSIMQGKALLEETSIQPLKTKPERKSAKYANETPNKCKVCHVFVSVWKPA